ncbi:hypothetical protein TNCT_685271, partial [Trichonephila clavata]
LRSAALQTIREHYPRSSWFHIYTDGSSLPRTGETSAVYYCQEFQGYSVVGAPLNNYDGEVAAIHTVASQLENCNNPAKEVFLVDSQTAIRNLSRNSQAECKRTIDCREKIELFVGSWVDSKVQMDPEPC